MARFFRGTGKKVGLPPGSLLYTGKQPSGPSTIHIFDYNGESLEEKEIEQPEDIFPYKDKDTTTWINIDGVHNVEVVEKICKHYNIHPLTIEDILNIEQRPKIEEGEDFIYVVLKMMDYDDKNDYVRTEQVSLLLGHKFVMSFQEDKGDIFEGVRTRIRSGKGKIRQNGADYLLYALIDTIVDNYFVALEKVGDQMEEIEVTLLMNASDKTLNDLYGLKREMLTLRRFIWPLREVIYKLERDDLKLVHRNTRVYIRDVYDHTIQVIDTVEIYRDLLSGLVDLYQSIVSNRMNQIMKVLTIISTIFIPLSFIAGVYGMNFKYMPELDEPAAYPIFWIAILALISTMLFFFKKKRWL